MVTACPFLNPAPHLPKFVNRQMQHRNPISTRILCLMAAPSISRYPRYQFLQRNESMCFIHVRWVVAGVLNVSLNYSLVIQSCNYTCFIVVPIYYLRSAQSWKHANRTFQRWSIFFEVCKMSGIEAARPMYCLFTNKSTCFYFDFVWWHDKFEKKSWSEKWTINRLLGTYAINMGEISSSSLYFGSPKGSPKYGKTR